MSRQKRETRPRMDLPEWQLTYLLTGDLAGSVEVLLWAEDSEAVRSAWEDWRDGLLRDFTRDNPGRRPAAWWSYDAPAPRLRVGGSGDVIPALDHPANLRNGIPRRKDDFCCDRLLRVVGHLDRKLVAFDENDPPRYESQASFLRRHGLLTAAERRTLPPGSFEPEVVR